MPRSAMVGLALIAGCVEQQNDMPSEEDIKAAHEHVLTESFPRRAALVAGLLIDS